MADDVLLVEKNNGLAVLTLNRPQAMNALNRRLRLALSDAFADLAENDDIGAVILTGAGKAFCAGLDIKELAAEGMTEAGERREGEGLIGRLAAFDRPIICGVNGPAVTGGFELALAGDILIASSKARFADTHARMGIMPGWGLSQKLSRLIGIQRAKELSLTGNYLSAEQAEAWGLVNRVVEPDQLLPACRALARDMLECPREMVVAYKRMIDVGFGLTYQQGRALEAAVSARQAAEVTAGAVGGRREAVMSRGRRQTED